MSAGAAGVFAPQHVRMPSRTTRPPLRLVGLDERPGPGRGDHRDVLVSGGKPPYGHWVGRTRLTRRGRLVVTLIIAGAVASLSVALTASVDAAAAQIDHATTVSAGQTLSEVAASQMSTLPTQNAVARIQLANGLNTAQVHAGQLLLIPAMP